MGEQKTNKELIKKELEDLNLPNVLQFTDGRIVANLSEWEQRREEINEGFVDLPEDDYSFIDEAENDYIEGDIDRLEIERKVSDLERKKLEKEGNIKTVEKKYYFYESDMENTYESAMALIANKREKKIAEKVPIFK